MVKFYQVADNEFNRANYPTLIRRIYRAGSVPSYANLTPLDTPDLLYKAADGLARNPIGDVDLMREMMDTAWEMETKAP